MPVNPLLPMELSDGTPVVLNRGHVGPDGFMRVDTYGVRAIAITTDDGSHRNMVFSADTGLRSHVDLHVNPPTLRNVEEQATQVIEERPMSNTSKQAIDISRPVETETGVRLTFVRVSPTSAQFTAPPGTQLSRDGRDMFGGAGYFFCLEKGHFVGDPVNHIRVRNVGGRCVPFRDRFGRVIPAPLLRKPPVVKAAKAAKPVVQVYNSSRSPTYRGHGGGCCGASHLSGFHGTPDLVWPFHSGGNGTDTMGGQFDAALQYIRKTRAAGRIEIILKRDQVKNWEAFILERGFRLVSRFINSNTSNMLTVYEYLYGVSNEGVKKAPAPANPFGKS